MKKIKKKKKSVKKSVKKKNKKSSKTPSGDLIVRFMEEEEVTVRGLAEAAGTSPTTVVASKKERNLQLHTFIDLIEALGARLYVVKDGEKWQI